MNKINVKQMILSLFIHEFIGAGCAAILSTVLCKKDFSRFQHFFVPLVIFALIVALIVWALRMAWGGSAKKAKITFEQGLEENGIRPLHVLEATDAYFGIDQARKKVAYVSFKNNQEFQIADGYKLSNIKSDYIKGPLGGTTGVYLSFTYEGKTTRLYTYLNNRAVSLNNPRVRDAIIDAEFYTGALCYIGGTQNS